MPAGSAVPNGEACMWGDYHLLELAVLVQRLGRGGTGSPGWSRAPILMTAGGYLKEVDIMLDYAKGIRVASPHSP